ncbi:hypothetical protein ACFQ3N_18995 [Virgibacillus byunsanensis]|uniref:GNAT family N-acetyltransferase n=1 Tax=Virgibacillus byunsanensis TaxID=570945 RepID=A0ABW3LQZ9_9BACI
MENEMLNRQDLYEKVKLVKGKDFLTIEDTEELNTEEMLYLISHLITDPSVKEISSLNILVNSKFTDRVDFYLKKNDFQFDDELVTVFKILQLDNTRDKGFTFKSLHEVSREDFIHIWEQTEPGTEDEGRLFYFGLIPSERGKGKSKLLHLQAIQMLESDLHASFYIGCTSKNNTPMLKTFMNNGCTELKRYRAYKRKTDIVG